MSLATIFCNKMGVKMGGLLQKTFEKQAFLMGMA